MIGKKKVQSLVLCLSAASALIAALANAAVTDITPGSRLLAGAFTPAAKAGGEEMVSTLIVKPRQGGGEQLANSLRAFDASALSGRASVPLTVVRPMSGRAHVLKLHKAVTLSEARVIAARLMRDSSVEFAEPDRILHPLSTTPTDPDYATLQWHYQAPSGGNKGGVNLPNAWDVTKGSSAIIVAVIDTGYRPHADLGTVVPGYDFISNIATANDGDGRDADARDPGNWVAANECSAGSSASNSSWHGTHVAGTIAALMNNGLGGTGVAPNVKILPVRALGKCGGATSDIVDAMRWSAGIAVSGVPANANPAKVLNMSLGSASACSIAMQSAVTDVVSAGAVVVAANGNNGTLAVGQPANCTGVIAVAAHALNGEVTIYSDLGAETAISAPGGWCSETDYIAGGGSCSSVTNPLVYSLSNAGTTTPGVDTYVGMAGTSMATPHVAGVAALMLSVKPALTPAQIKTYLQAGVRSFPAGTGCATGQAYAGKCGAGLLDAVRALNAIPAAPPVVSLTGASATTQVVAPGATVTLSGSATADPTRIISSYAWTQVSGASVGAISNANTTNASITAPATGTYSFRLSATDNNAQTGIATAIVRVNSVPVLTASATQAGSAGSTISFNVAAIDVDGDTPIFHSVSLPPGASLSAAGAFSWPNAGPVGTYTLTYYASDNDANSSTGSVAINVTAASSGGAISSSGGSGGGGGGGSFDEGALAALALLALGLRLRRAMK